MQEPPNHSTLKITGDVVSIRHEGGEGWVSGFPAQCSMHLHWLASLGEESVQFCLRGSLFLSLLQTDSFNKGASL